MNNNNLWQLEDSIYSEGFSLLAGVDEAGRGPLAGPVCAAAVILPEGCIIEGVNDSKKLTEKKRDALFDVIVETAVSCSIAFGTVEEIERDNILAATICEPVGADGLASRSVWLPAGTQWYDMAHRKLMDPGVYKLAYSIGQNAWFVKAGAIIPMAREGIQNLQEASDAWRIFIAPGKGRSEYVHYEDDGESQAYPTQFATTRIVKNATGSGLTVEIGPRQGAYKGMCDTRVLTLVLGGMKRCPSATLDGRPLEVKYCEDTLEATIILPSHAATQPVTVVVRGN